MDGLEFKPPNHKNFKSEDEGFNISEMNASSSNQNFPILRPGNQQPHSTQPLILPKQSTIQENTSVSQPPLRRKNSQNKSFNNASNSNGISATVTPRPLKPRPKEIKPKPANNNSVTSLNTSAPVYHNGMYIDPNILNLKNQNSFIPTNQSSIYPNIRSFMKNIPIYPAIRNEILPAKPNTNSSFVPITQQNSNFPQFFNSSFTNNLTSNSNTLNSSESKRQRTGPRQNSDLPLLAPNIQPGFNPSQGTFNPQQVNPGMMQRPIFPQNDVYNSISNQLRYNLPSRTQLGSSLLPSLPNTRPAEAPNSLNKVNDKVSDFEATTMTLPITSNTSTNSVKDTSEKIAESIPVLNSVVKNTVNKDGLSAPLKSETKPLTSVFDSKPPKQLIPVSNSKEHPNTEFTKNTPLAPKPVSKGLAKFPEIAPKKVHSPLSIRPAVTKPPPSTNLQFKPPSELPLVPFKDKDGFYVPTSLPIKGLGDKSPSAISPIPIDTSINPLKRVADELTDDPVDRSFQVSPIAACQLPYQINGLSHTNNMRWIVLGSDDGFIRKYDFFDSINGKLPLTASQRHATIDVCSKAGVLLSYWDNQLHSNSTPLPSSSLNEFDSRFSPVLSLYLHSDAIWCLSGQNNGDVNLSTVRFDEGKCHVALKGHTSTVSVIKPLDNETKAISGSWDKTVKIWDLNTGDKIYDLTRHINQISSVNCQPINGSQVSNSLLLTTSIDGRSSLWDLRDPSKPKFQMEPPAGCPKWATSSCFNITGDTIYTGRRNNTVDCYDLRKSEYARTLRLPSNSGSVSAVAFHPTRNFLAIGSFDNFRMWNLDHFDVPKTSSTFLSPFQLVPGHQSGTISQIAFDHTGKYLITTSGNRGWEGTSTNSAIFYEVKFH